VHFLDYEPKWILIDGDKIAALFSLLLVRELKEAVMQNKDRCKSEFSLGVVQTAYANGASTRYLHSIGVQTAIAKTGVKYVHHKAGYDAYFSIGWMNASILILFS